MQTADEPGLPVPTDPWRSDSLDCPLDPWTGCYPTSQLPPGSPVVVRVCHGCGRVDGHHLAEQIAQLMEDAEDDAAWNAEVEETIRLGWIQLQAEEWLKNASVVQPQMGVLEEVLRGQVARRRRIDWARYSALRGAGSRLVRGRAISAAIPAGRSWCSRT